jgi:hypothetical protein
MDAETSRRVVYVATGERHLRESAESLRSLWRHEPDARVTMYVDGPNRKHWSDSGIPPSPGGDLLEIVDHPDPTYSWADKPVALSDGGEDDERVLFLDADTRICGGIADLFELLDAFDLAAAHAPIRLDPRQPESLAGRVPAAFPELNTGVIAFRRTSAVAALLDRWRALHLETVRSLNGGRVGDQSTLRVALFESAVRFTVLRPEDNCRFVFPTYVQGPVRILHGRGPDLERVERDLNATFGPRVYVPGVGVVTAHDTIQK